MVFVQDRQLASVRAVVGDIVDVVPTDGKTFSIIYFTIYCFFRSLLLWNWKSVFEELLPLLQSEDGAVAVDAGLDEVGVGQLEVLLLRSAAVVTKLGVTQKLVVETSYHGVVFVESEIKEQLISRLKHGTFFYFLSILRTVRQS